MIHMSKISHIVIELDIGNAECPIQFKGIMKSASKMKSRHIRHHIVITPQTERKVLKVIILPTKKTVLKEKILPTILKHTRVHARENTHQCTICQETFENHMNLNSHKKTDHATPVIIPILKNRTETNGENIMTEVVKKEIKIESTFQDLNGAAAAAKNLFARCDVKDECCLKEDPDDPFENEFVQGMLRYDFVFPT